MNLSFLDTNSLLFLAGSAALYLVGAYLMGLIGGPLSYIRSRRKPIKSKEQRRQIGIVLIAAGTLFLGITILTMILTIQG